MPISMTDDLTTFDPFSAEDEATRDDEEEELIIMSSPKVDLSIEDDEPDSELDFDGRYERLIASMDRSPIHRELCYKMLAYCQEQRLLASLETFVQEAPEYHQAVQSPYSLIVMLEDAGGLERLLIGDDGSTLDDETLVDETPDHIDDLVADYAFLTSEVGRALVEDNAPKHRMRDLFDTVPHRTDTFLEVMDFCSTPRSFGEVDELLRGRDILSLGRKATEQALQPSYFIDRLERVGGVVWNKDSWIITPEGREMLEVMLKRN
jgi:hypothetical protein